MNKLAESGKKMISVLVLMLCSCHKAEDSGVTENHSHPKPAASQLGGHYYLKHDFGEVDRNQTLIAKLSVCNSDSEPILLSYCKTTCGCFKVKSMPAKVEPGDTGVLEVELETGAGRRGPQQWQAVLGADDPKQHLIKLSATALVRSCWTDVESFDLGIVHTGDEIRKRFFVFAAGYPEAHVVSATTDAKWISLDSKETESSPELAEQRIKAIGCYELQWDGTGVSPGNLLAKIVVKLQASKEETLEIPVTAFLSGNAMVIPAILNFGVFTAADVVRRCTLKADSSIDISRLQVTAEHSCVQVDVTKDADVSDQWVMTVHASLPKEISGSLLQGKIVGSDADGTAVFVVPYTGILSIPD